MLNKLISIILASLCYCVALSACEQGDDNNAPVWSDGSVTETPLLPPDEEQGGETDEKEETENSDPLDDGGIWTDRYK